MPTPPEVILTCQLIRRLTLGRRPPVDGDNNLRGGAGAEAGDYIYQNLFNFIGTVHCDTCRDSDDDDVVPMSGNELAVAGTATHDLWVGKWCTMLKGGSGAFAGTTSCSIEITNCDQSKIIDETAEDKVQPLVV